MVDIYALYCLHNHMTAVQRHQAVHGQASLHQKGLHIAQVCGLQADYASQEVQFGCIHRVTNRNTVIEKAKFEVSNHKYTDLPVAPSQGHFPRHKQRVEPVARPPQLPAISPVHKGFHVPLFIELHPGQRSLQDTALSGKGRLLLSVLLGQLKNSAATSQVVADGPVEYRIRNSYRLSAKSTLEQDVIFYAHSPEVVFETRMDWQDDHRFLKAAFDTSIQADYASQSFTLMPYLQSFSTATP